MNREHHRWHSPSLRREMDLLVFGHSGARVLVFPTSMGRFYEWEDQGMIGALGEQIERGWLQLYCVDSVDAESWYAKHLHPHDRVRRQEEYEVYLLHEVLPLSRQKNGDPFLIATGASFGAFHAVNFAFRHPWHVGRVLGLSGLYDLREIAGGHSDDRVYFHNPAEFVRHEHDWGRLDALRRIDVILAIGRTDPNARDSERFSATLWEKGLPHALRMWDGWAHDWPYWRQMIVKYIGGHD